ncbi:TPA: hypothetical protein DCL30_00175 [Candidatus Peribacteria bacterium]|nr:hypothetical protein [Candidatus Peribacteria bacterium]
MPITTRLFDNQRPCDELLALLEQLKVSHVDTLRGIREVTQTWVVPGKLRAQISDDEDRARLPEFLDLFRSLRMVDEISIPESDDPDAPHPSWTFATIGGAKRRAVEGRWDLLNRLLPRINVQQIVSLGSGRTLFTDEQLPDLTLGVESQLMTQVALSKHSMRGIRLNCVHCPKPSDRNASLEDTMKAWIDGADPRGDVLGIFSQPYTLQQGAAAQIVYGNRGRITAIGYSAPSSVGVRGYLDNVAKWIDAEFRLVALGL